MVGYINPLSSGGSERSGYREYLENFIFKSLLDNPFSEEPWRNLREEDFKSAKTNYMAEEDLLIEYPDGEIEKRKKRQELKEKMKKSARKAIKIFALMLPGLIVGAITYTLLHLSTVSNLDYIKTTLEDEKEIAASNLNTTVNLEAQINQSLATVGNFLDSYTYTVSAVEEHSPEVVSVLLKNQHTDHTLNLTLIGKYLSSEEFKSFVYPLKVANHSVPTAAEKVVVLPQNKEYYSVVLVQKSGEIKELAGTVSNAHNSNFSFLVLILDPDSELYLKNGQIISFKDLTALYDETQSKYRRNLGLIAYKPEFQRAVWNQLKYHSWASPQIVQEAWPTAKSTLYRARHSQEPRIREGKVLTAPQAYARLQNLKDPIQDHHKAIVNYAVAETTAEYFSKKLPEAERAVDPLDPLKLFWGFGVIGGVIEGVTLYMFKDDISDYLGEEDYW